MIVEKFSVKKSDKISSLIQDRYSGFSYAAIQKLFRNKDIKVNGLRINKDIVASVGDEICFYVQSLPKKEFDVVYQDENIIVVFKPAAIETVSQDSDDLEKQVSNQIGALCYAVHRLDRNTEGLVIFAKTLDAKNQLDDAFKKRTIDKFYVTLVYGLMKNKKDELVAYLKKDAKQSLVYVSDKQLNGFEKIQTNYKVLKEFEDSSLLEVELVTGKTHQIRAHLSYVGHFVIGDEKYGNSEINKIFKRKKQALCAYKIIFHFKSGVLSYLDGKEILLDKSKIDFCQNL